MLFGSFATGLFINSTNAAEIFDPTTSQFTAVGNLNADREGASGTALPNGKILVAGGASCAANSSGSTCNALNTAELFDPGTGTFTLAGSGSGNKMVSARFAHNAALISGCNCALDGDVLLVGGDSGTFTITGTGLTTTPQPNQSANTAIQAELYDFRTDTFTATGSLKTGVESAAVAAIPNSAGKVLIAGGDDQGFFQHSIATAEIYNPATETFSLTGSLKTARELPSSIALDPTIVTGGLSGETTISMSPAMNEQRAVAYAEMVPMPSSGGAMPLVVGLSLIAIGLAGAGLRRRRQVWLMAAGAILLAAAAAGCGGSGENGVPAKPSSTQTVTAVGAMPASNFSGLPVTLGTIKLS